MNTNKELLLKEVEKSRADFRSNGYSMSIGEISNIYDSGELDIHPEFQRSFRWSNMQKVRLIESVLLGLPIPPIFVFQNKDGKWELIDGQQRVSTFLQFMGKLKNSEGELLERLTLQETQYLPHLNGLGWSDDPEESSNTLPYSLRLSFKRHRLDVQILTSNVGEQAKFDLFDRLNTGGSFASAQEIRNNRLLMSNSKVYHWLDKLSKDQNFIDTVALSDKLIAEAYDQELVLRFIALVKYDYTSSEFGEFLNSVSKHIAEDEHFDMVGIETIFNSTFELLNLALEYKSFKKYDTEVNDFKGKFMVSAFEGISVGLANNIHDYTKDDIALLQNRIKKLHCDKEYKSCTSSGTNTSTRIKHLIPLAITIFKK